jgi:uncharacterized protein YjbJ (UPF0337 family)
MKLKNGPEDAHPLLGSQTQMPGGNMKRSAKDQIKGKLHEVKGQAREKMGQVTGNRKLAAKGQMEKLAGKVQRKVGQIAKMFGK